MSAQKKKTTESDTGAKQAAEQVIDPAALALLTRQTRDLLAFHAQMGLTRYPASPELRKILFRAQSVPAVPPPASPAKANRGQEMNRGRDRDQHTAGQYNKYEQDERHGTPALNAEKAGKKNDRPTPQLTEEATVRQLKIIAEELADCQCCPSGSKVIAGRTAIPAMPGQGSSRPRLLVVGDCCIGADPQQGVIWGREEDEMFWKMMAAIGLDRGSVYVTNAVKCPQKDLVQPGAAVELEQSCFSFLEKELLAIRPQLICAMGDIATRALLKSKTPLVRLRGRFHPYRYPHGEKAGVMPTFHPRFLLRHPEMKRATWEDLQAVQRKL